MSNITREKIDLNLDQIERCKRRYEFRWMKGMYNRKNSNFNEENVRKLIQDGSVDPRCAQVFIKEMSQK